MDSWGMVCYVMSLLESKVHYPTITASAHNGGKEDSKDLRRLPTVTSE